MGSKEKILISALTVGAFIVGATSATAGSFSFDNVGGSGPMTIQDSGSCKSGSCKGGSCKGKEKKKCDPEKDKDCEKKKGDTGGCGSGSCG